jgi:drug/metabolite transporter (DMT)-like permease
VIRDRTRGAIALVVVTALWGVSFPLVGEAVDGRSQGQVLYFLFLRFGLASLAFLPLAGALREATRQAGSAAWGRAFSLGAVLFCGFYLQSIGLQYTTPSRCAFITMLSVPMVPLLAAVWKRRAPSSVHLLGSIFAVLGVSLVLAPGGDLRPNLGDGLTFVSAFFFALGILVLESITRRTPLLIVASGQIFGVALLCGLALGVVPLELPEEWPGLWLGVGVTGIVCTSLALALMTWGQARVSAELAAIIFALEPIFAALFVWIYLGEALGPLQGLGGGIVFASVVWAARQPEKNPV